MQFGASLWKDLGIVVASYSLWHGMQSFPALLQGAIVVDTQASCYVSDFLQQAWVAGRLSLQVS